MRLGKAISFVNIAILFYIISNFILFDIPSSPFVVKNQGFLEKISQKIVGALYLSLGFSSIFILFGLLVANSFFLLKNYKNHLIFIPILAIPICLSGILSFVNESYGGLIGLKIKSELERIGVEFKNSLTILSLLAVFSSLPVIYPAILKLAKSKRKKVQEEINQTTYAEKDEDKVKYHSKLVSEETSHSTMILEFESAKPKSEEEKSREDYEKTQILDIQKTHQKEEKIDDSKESETENNENFNSDDEDEENYAREKDLKRFVLPSPDLLDPPETNEYDPPETLHKVARELISVLNSFGVRGKIISMTSGPVVNFFEFIPESGIRATRIVQLSEDIAIAMRLPGIRIVAPVPTSGAVGFEIPRKKRNIVKLSEIFNSPSAEKMKIPLTIGKDIYGKPFVIDLHKLPHLLVAGTTGSGKSVLLNTIIISLLLRFTPDELKFILVDPKMLEFSLYSGIPNLITDVITSPKGAIDVLRWAVEEMISRYQTMKKNQAKNLDDFIEKTGEKMPRIVIVIDEFADLMVSSARKVEEYVMRLSQMARAAGIHLILTTQRPSADVVTGIIKSNLPARIALRVSDKINSRVILDTNGAETLLGQGDFLFSMPGITPQRGHAAYTSDKEIMRIVEHLKKQQKPNYIEIVSQDEEDDIFSASDILKDKDPKFKEAVEIAKNYGQISISLLQRKLGIGFNRAARIVEEMEELGIVKKQDKKLVFVGLPSKKDENQKET
jgi:S-DNA-T family DNA segregation ATPase FtsK/SpoIIIE